MPKQYTYMSLTNSDIYPLRLGVNIFSENFSLTSFCNQFTYYPDLLVIEALNLFITSY